MGGTPRALTLLCLISTICAGGAEAASWSSPTSLAPPRTLAHDARIVYTTRGEAVALVNRQAPEGFDAFRSAGAGAFASFGQVAPANQRDYSALPTPDGGVIAGYAAGGGLYTSTNSGETPFGPAQLLPGSDFAAFPRFAVAGNGDVFAVWTTAICDSGCPPHNTVRVAIRHVGSAEFEQAQQLSAPSAHASAPQIVVDRDGNALVTWWSSTDSSAERAHLAYALRRTGGSFGRERTLQRRPGVTGFRIASDDQGRTTIVWNSLGKRAVQAATGTTTSGFGRPRRLGDGPGGSGQVASGRGGRAVLAWTEGTRERLIRMASVTGGRIGRPRTIARGPAHSLDALIDPRGRRILTWREIAHGTRSLHAALATRGKRFVEKVLDPGRTLFYSLGSTSRGDTIVTWLVSLHDGWHVRAASASPSGQFGRSIQLDRRGDSPSIPLVAAGPSGKALVYWPQTPKRGNGATVMVRYFRR